MSRARGGGAPSAQTRPRPFNPGGYNKGDVLKAWFSAALALGGCTDTALVEDSTF